MSRVVHGDGMSLTWERERMVRAMRECGSQTRPAISVDLTLVDAGMFRSPGG